MAQFYTLDEAAQRLNIPVDEFKRKTKTEWTSLRPFRDGATLRYRAADIDELARSLGAASDPGLLLGPVGSALGDSSEEMALSADSPIDFGPDSGVNKGDDIFTLAPGDAGKAGKGKPPGDSDVRLDLSPKSDKLGRKPTGEMALEASKPPSSAKLTAPKSGARLNTPGSGRVPAAPPPSDTDSSSEFELRLDADSDSFDLPLDGSDEVDIAATPKAKKGPQSGINLGKPTDSGVSLEKRRPPADEASDMDFELSLDAPPSGKLGSRTGPIRRVAGVDSSSEFELTLDDSSGSAESFIAGAQEENKGDIFETDFDLPAVDESGSEVVAVETDTDLDGGFEVDVSSDDMAAVAADDSVEIEEEAEPSAARALRGVSRDEDDDYPAAGVRTVVAAPPVWGPLPAAVLLPCMVFLFLGSLMSFEALRGMWGYHQPSKPAGALVRGVAEAIGGKVAD